MKKFLIKNKLLFLSFVSIITIVFGFTINQYHIVLSEKEDIRNSLLSLTYTTHQAVKSWADEKVSSVKNIAEFPELSERVESLLDTPTQKEMKALNELLMPILSIKKYKGYRLLDKNWVTIMSNRSELIGKKSAYQEREKFFSKLQHGIASFMPPVHANDNGESSEPLVFVGAPVRNTDEDIVGYLLFFFDPNIGFSEIFKFSNVGETGETYAFNQEGFFVIESRFTEELKEQNFLKKDENSILNIRITDPGEYFFKKTFLLQKKMPLTKMASSALQGYSNVDLEGYRNYRGKKVIGAWVWDPNLELGIASEIDLKEAYQSLHYNTIMYAIISAFSIMLLFGIITLFFRNRAEIIMVNKSLEEKIENRTQELARKNELLENLALIDSLTELPNRRQFDKCIQDEFKRASRTGSAVSMMMVDIDYFKKVNDFYGHTYGDMCLQKVSRAFKSILHRESDFVARYGGEEFAFILPNTSKESAMLIAELLLKKVRELQIPNEPSDIAEYLTISIGVSTISPMPNSKAEELIEQADKKLYQAKEQGRNRVCY